MTEKTDLKDHKKKRLKANKELKKLENPEKRGNQENKDNQESLENKESQGSQESKKMVNKLLREMAEREETEMVNNDLLKLYLNKNTSIKIL